MNEPESRVVVERDMTANDDAAFAFARRGRCWGDLIALLVWTTAIVVFFWSTVTLQRALFYFDITEINYPYRAFFAEELRAGRFSRWFPGLYCGMPLYSESQAGYLHPFKYVLYPWLETWQAFNLDTVLSVWLTGLGTYLWLRRHVGPAGALTGASVFGLSGFVWGHLIHTSMINALASVPFVIWGLEWSWETGRWRGAVLGGVALACQVFAGHLQDTLLTAGIVGLYGIYRAATERDAGARLATLSMPIVLGVVGVLLSAIQWVPSKELLDRSPRAGGLAWEDLVFASWHPELLPTLVVREAYGTRARDTQWMNGYYPYHEMNAYMGLVAMGLAVVGASGACRRDRWVNFWAILVGVGSILMLGKFTALFDFAHWIPVAGSSREPVRLHLWVSLGVAALAAVGVERLGRRGVVSLRGGLVLALLLVVVSIPILCYLYSPIWTDPNRWGDAYHRDRFRWLGRELSWAAGRTAVVAVIGYWVAKRASVTRGVRWRARWASLLPLVVIVDLLGAHWVDVPTVDPRYWTTPPASARMLKNDPSLVRIFGLAEKSSGEPGYASEKIDFMRVRDTLDWSLPPVWKISSSRGNTPMIPRRIDEFARATENGSWRHDLEGDSYIVTGKNLSSRFSVYLPTERVGTAFVHRNTTGLPRARMMAKVHYASSEQEAITALERLGNDLRERVVVEDPRRPIETDGTASGLARIVEDLPERVVIETDANGPAYLVLSDTFDPGWTATVDGKPEPIVPAYVTFRAVTLTEGRHEVVFEYRPAGFVLGAGVSTCGLVLALGLWWRRRPLWGLTPEHSELGWPSQWRIWWFGLLGAIVIVSIVIPIGFRGVEGRRGAASSARYRWTDSVHTFTWGAGFAAMKANRR
jgi:hypothetical protein